MFPGMYQVQTDPSRQATHDGTRKVRKKLFFIIAATRTGLQAGLAHDRVSKLLSPSLLVVRILATRYGFEQRQLDARHNGDLIPDGR